MLAEKRVSRRKFLVLGATAGVGAAAAPLLTSCTEKLPEVAASKVIIETQKLEPNSAFTFLDTETDEPRVLVRLPDGGFALYSAECTHNGCTVGYEPEEQYLICPCHKSKFRAEDGDVVTGPADKPLPGLAVKVENGKISTA